MPTLFQGADGRDRCHWCQSTPEYMAYHDLEWGFPVDDDHRLFEKICLEGFQSGLSWRTVLSKRENFRAAFHNFDFTQVATFDENDILRLLADESIIRHRGKIEATINNAKRALELVKREGSLASFLWRYASPTGLAPQFVAFTPQSLALSKELKRRGWKFVGPTTMYALMQANGLVNDHAEGCAFRLPVEQARQNFLTR